MTSDGSGVIPDMEALLLLFAFVTFDAPHAVRASRASIDGELAKAIDASAADAEPIEAALAITDAHLHFGLSHHTSLRFEANEREGNCIEYAELFAAVHNRLAARQHRAERAWVVRSDARVMGRHLGRPGLDDHDWVLVTNAGKTRFIDPTFHDMGLAADIASIVKGDIRGIPPPPKPVIPTNGR